MYDLDQVDTVPIEKINIRFDSVTGTLLDFALAEVNGTYFQVKAISDSYIVVRCLDNSVGYEELISPLPTTELLKLQNILQRYTTLQLVPNFNLNFHVFLGVFYTKHQLVDCF